MSLTRNLWPTDITNLDGSIYPLAALEAQAYHLNVLTKNVLIATVSKTSFLSDDGQQMPGMLYVLRVSAPMLGNYTIELVQIRQGQVSTYPVTIYSPLSSQSYTAHDDLNVDTWLGSIFSDKKISDTIKSLLLQSNFKV